MSPSRRPPLVPAAFFGIVVGLVGLATAWRAAHRVWGLPAIVGELVFAVACLVWVVVLALFVAKWVFARDDALAEARHPVFCCFIALVGVATMLVGIGLLPYGATAAAIVFWIGAAFSIAFAVWRTGQLWTGGRDPATNTAVLYLPTVGTGFVAAIGAAAFGRPSWGAPAFGVRMRAWLAIESVLLHRLLTAPPLVPPLRPTLGIQLAPPVVAANAYLAITTGVPDAFAHALIGYGVLQALILIRLLPWIHAQPFAASYWGFTFGITALATAPLRMIERGDSGAIADLAPVLFVAANVAMAAIAIGTLRLIVQRRLLPPAATPPTVAVGVEAAR